MGHTESIRLRLAEQRQKLGLDPDTVWERLVAELTERRMEQGMSQPEAARRLRELEEGHAEGPKRGTRISNYEKMEREPRIDEFAAWARALGMRLHVELEPLDSPRKAIMVHPEKVELAKTIDLLDPVKVPAALRIAEALLTMSRSEVRKLAEFVTTNADE